jgi:hypothetical protein
MAVLRWGMLFLERRGALDFLPSSAHYLARLAIFAFVSVAVGVAFSKIIERPVLAFRDRLVPSRAKALLAQVPAKESGAHVY